MSEAHPDVSDNQSLLNIKIRLFGLYAFIFPRPCNHYVLHAENISYVLVVSYHKLIVNIAVIPEFLYIALLTADGFLIRRPAHLITKNNLRLIHAASPSLYS